MTFRIIDQIESHHDGKREFRVKARGFWLHGAAHPADWSGLGRFGWHYLPNHSGAYVTVNPSTWHEGECHRWPSLESARHFARQHGETVYWLDDASCELEEVGK